MTSEVAAANRDSLGVKSDVQQLIAGQFACTTVVIAIAAMGFDLLVDAPEAVAVYAVARRVVSEVTVTTP